MRRSVCCRYDYRCVVYEYAIKAVSADGTFESGLSSIKEVIFLSKIETVKVSSYAGGVKVSWSAVNGAEEYAVYRRLSTGSWEVIKTVSASTLSYKIQRQRVVRIILIQSVQ